MKRYECGTCGRESNQPADYNDQKDKLCPYAGCGGIVYPALPSYLPKEKQRIRDTIPGLLASAIYAGIVVALCSFVIVAFFSALRSCGKDTGTAGDGQSSVSSVDSSFQKEPETVEEHDNHIAPETVPIKSVAVDYEEWSAATAVPLIAAVGPVMDNTEPSPAAADPSQDGNKADTYFPMTDSERSLVEWVCMAEASGSEYDGIRLVAQCILDACVADNLRPDVAIIEYQYSSDRTWAPTDTVKEAVAAVFDRGDFVTDEPILWFYAPALCTSNWHESKCFVLEAYGHRFFKAWA
jgi:hypothetical protein